MYYFLVGAWAEELEEHCSSLYFENTALESPVTMLKM